MTKKFEVGKPASEEVCKCGGKMFRVYDDIDQGGILPDGVSWVGHKMLWGSTFSGQAKKLI
jgi:hypothetical protein